MCRGTRDPCHISLPSLLPCFTPLLFYHRMQFGIKTWKNYIQELEWFFQHGVTILVTNPVLGKVATTEEERQRVQQQAEVAGLHPDTAPRQSLFHLIEATKHLSEFQREFRQLFGRFVSGTTVQILERHERDILNDTFALWRWLAFAPHIINQQPRLSSQQHVEKMVAKCQRRLQQGLQELSTSFLQLTQYPHVVWNQEPVLCVLLAAQQALQQFQVLQPTLEMIHRVLHSVHDYDLTRYALTRKWESLIIVPLLDGKSVSGTAWRINMSVFLNWDSLAELKWWNLSQHVLPEDTSRSIMVTQWEQQDMHHVVQLGEEVSRLRLMVAHLHDIHQLPDPDAEGLEIAQHYVQEYQEILSKQLQATIDTLEWMDNFVGQMREHSQVDQQTFKVISEGIQEVVADVLPMPYHFSQEMKISLTAMESWLERLEAVLVKVLILQTLVMDILKDLHEENIHTSKVNAFSTSSGTDMKALPMYDSKGSLPSQKGSREHS